VRRNDGRGFFVEFTFPDEDIYPNQVGGVTPVQRYKRGVTFALSRTRPGEWSTGNDWSCDGMTDQLKVAAQIPVYHAGLRLDGEEPDRLIDE
jgi:hypothetical protein